jgi:deoxyguanosine kinase
MTIIKTDLTDRYPHIVIEGPIGSGKTTLARKLADRYAATLLLENAEANPFLPRFYQDVQRYALPTQLFFLFQRSGQLSELAQRDMFAAAMIADFFLEKDPIFARLNLDDEEFALYRQIYKHLQPKAPVPDLVIYLQTPVDALQERIAQRNIPYEQEIAREYLVRLSDAYSEFFHQYDASPILIVNNEKLNITTDEASVDMLVERALKIRSRREFFNPSLE